MWTTLCKRARLFRRDAFALIFAVFHPDTPWHAKVIVTALLVYTLSPIDLIPDVIPVLGYLDDLIIDWFGISLVARLIPDQVMLECRARAAAAWKRLVIAVALFVLLWMAITAVALYYLLRWLANHWG